MRGFSTDWLMTCSTSDALCPGASTFDRNPWRSRH
jgi:hypothetical protein